ncbi:MAG: hypothetical protein PHD05_03850 [Sphaerochaetaceae bacterium]|nr:hypothetical protein [Sphaerochaetaceae bacterium]
MSQTERILYIFQEIGATGAFKIENVCNKYEVGERTVKRDIEYIRDRLKIKLFWNKNSQSYSIYQKSKREENSNEKLLVAKSIYKKVEETYGISSLYGEGIKGFLNSGIAPEFRDLSDRVIFLSNISEACNFDLFFEILKAIKGRTSVSFDYDKEQNLIITPYVIINIGYDWKLMGFDKEDRQMKIYSLSKISRFIENKKSLVN